MSVSGGLRVDASVVGAVGASSGSHTGHSAAGLLTPECKMSDSPRPTGLNQSAAARTSLSDTCGTMSLLVTALHEVYCSRG